jgi:hypothetical protein
MKALTTACLGNENYAREFYIFNLCFVIDMADPREDKVYEPIVQKCAEYLINLEKEEAFLTTQLDKLPSIMQQMFDDLNREGELFENGVVSKLLDFR